MWLLRYTRTRSLSRSLFTHRGFARQSRGCARVKHTGAQCRVLGWSTHTHTHTPLAHRLPPHLWREQKPLGHSSSTAPSVGQVAASTQKPSIGLFEKPHWPVKQSEPPGEGTENTPVIRRRQLCPSVAQNTLPGGNEAHSATNSASYSPGSSNKVHAIPTHTSKLQLTSASAAQLTGGF